MYTLENLEKDIQKYTTQSNKLPRSKRAVIKLPKTVKMLDLCVLSNILIGLTISHSRIAEEEKPFRLNKLRSHIQELSKRLPDIHP